MVSPLINGMLLVVEPGMLIQMERRLTAILAADVVGFSRLMGLDEAGTLSGRRYAYCGCQFMAFDAQRS